MIGDLSFAPLVEVSRQLAKGAISPVELTEASLARVEAINPRLNAYLSITRDSALAEAKAAATELRQGRRRGPLHGVPIAIKDLFHTAGVASTFGALA